MIHVEESQCSYLTGNEQLQRPLSMFEAFDTSGLVLGVVCKTYVSQQYMRGSRIHIYNTEKPVGTITDLIASSAGKSHWVTHRQCDRNHQERCSTLQRVRVLAGESTTTFRGVEDRVGRPRLVFEYSTFSMTFHLFYLYFAICFLSIRIVDQKEREREREREESVNSHLMTRCTSLIIVIIAFLTTP